MPVPLSTTATCTVGRQLPMLYCRPYSRSTIGGLAISEARDLPRIAAELASDRKAEDVVALDIRRLTFIADFFVICTVPAERQMRIVSDVLIKELKEGGGQFRRREGAENSGWVLLDFGDLIVHLFSPKQRSYYRLEQLWSEAVTIVRFQ